MIQTTMDTQLVASLHLMILINQEKIRSLYMCQPVICNPRISAGNTLNFESPLKVFCM